MPTPRVGRSKSFGQVRDLEGDADSQSRLQKIILAKSETWKAMPTPRVGWRKLFGQPSPRLGRRCRLPESAGVNYLAKSETWKAMPTPRVGWSKFFGQVRDLEGDVDSQSRLEKIIYAKSKTWKAMPTPRADWRK
ncbi:hypothetical protein SESBI_44084 [Sesbania bispinosa]|nr:hypothetical protein SESBI_44084 [Sesbania bispinosa]